MISPSKLLEQLIAVPSSSEGKIMEIETFQNTCAMGQCPRSSVHQRLQSDFGQNAEGWEKGKNAQKKNYQQSLNKIFFKQFWKVVENTKVVHYFDNSKGIFLFDAKISTDWLQIKFKIYRQVEGATCQCQTGACGVP